MRLDNGLGAGRYAYCVINGRRIRAYALRIHTPTTNYPLPVFSWSLNLYLRSLPSVVFSRITLVKGAILLQERGWDARLPVAIALRRPLSHESATHGRCDARPTVTFPATAYYPVLISRLVESTRLSWPEWLVFTARRTYASSVLWVVILSVRLSVCLSVTRGLCD